MLVVVVPLTFHNVSIFLLSAVSRTFSHVDVTQHVKKCSKLQREEKKVDTLWKVNSFFCDTASSSEKIYKRDKRRREDEREEKKIWRDDKRRDRGEKTRRKR